MSDTIDSQVSPEKHSDATADASAPAIAAATAKSTASPAFSPYAVASIALLILAVAYFFAQNSSLKHKESDQVLRLQAELADSARSLNRTRSDAGLTPRDVSDIETPERIAERLGQDAQKLTRLLQLQLENNQEKERQIIEKNRQLAELLKAREQDAKNATPTPSAANSQASSAAIASLQQQLRASESKAAELSTALEQRPTREELTLSLARVKNLEAELTQLRRELLQAKPLALLALSDEELLEPARDLLKEFRTLEGKSDRDLSDAYNRFASTKRATFVREISFKAGIAELAVVDQDALKNALQAAPDNALFFVAGYTAPSADAAAPVISPAALTQVSQRATNIAQYLKSQIKGKQQIQAAIVGSTLRFSSTDLERNQVCEIWQLLP